MSVGAAIALLTVYLVGNIKEIKELSTFIQQVSQLPNGWYLLLSVQAISHLFSYLVPALFYWYYFEHLQWDDFQKQPLKAVSSLWIVLASVISIIPFTDLIIDLNQRLELPQLLSDVEEWMRRKEQENELLTNQLVAFNSVDQFVIALFVIGFVASIGEEVFFRGVIQRKLIEWTRNAHAGIWLAAILFSAIHFQFYGFFPRLVLGGLFGYLYLWSRNLWVPVLAHFINNGFIVLTIYCQHQPAYLGLRLKLDTSSWFWIALSIVGSIIVLFNFYRVNRRTESKLYIRF
ncbi:hypothetical protein GCM10028774_20730 [Spirosoma jeollabukense]